MIRTISAKFIIGFFLIFCLSFLLLNQIVTEVIRTSNQNIITDDLIGLKNNSDVYVRQAFMINHYTNDDLYFGQMAEEMVGDLRHATSSDVSAYTVDGVFLHSTEQSAFSGRTEEDLKLALQGKTAYTISYDSGTTSVLYSYPVVIDGVEVGILRFAKDFTLLYEQSVHILDIIFYIALAIFAAAFLFSYMLSRHITVPLVKLADASTEVMNGNLDVRLTVGRNDEISRLAANFNDMIGRIKSQFARIERDRDRLEELNLQQKHFFDNVTHELKTPLTSILGYAEIIRENGEEDRKFFDKGMNHIVEESKRLHEMVLKLLELSSETAERDEFGPVDTGNILQDVCDAMAFKAMRYNKTIRLESQDRLLVHGQPDRLRQLFINLLDNAIKYGSAHSDIRVEAAPDSGFVRFSFVNPGEPIVPERLATIFESSQQTGGKPKEVGSVGLGLGIAKAIVDEHGGIIRIESEQRKICVEVKIPLMKAESQL